MKISAKWIDNISLVNRRDMAVSDILVCITFYFLLLIIFPIEPSDDLFRHLRAYQYGYNYREMYPFSPGVPSFNMYLLFDMVAGKIHSIFGSSAFIPIQIMVMSVFAAGMFWLLKGATSTNLRCILLFAALALCFGRLVLARPSTFESGLFLIALAATNEDDFPWWGHTIIGLVMAGFYYLFWIYLIPLAALRRSYFIPLVIGLAGWFAYGGMEYVQVLHSILTIKSHRGVEIVEGAPIFYAFLAVSFLLVPVTLYWRENPKRLLAACFFFLSNQARYLEVIIPSFLSFMKHWPVRIPQTTVFLIVLTLCFYRTNTSTGNSYKVLKDAVPAGSNVLVLEQPAMFKAVFAIEKVRISPSMEVGWDSAGVVSAIKQASLHGKFDHNVLKANLYDYIIEQNLREIPSGLELVKVAGPYRVWKVIKTPRQ